MMKKYEKEYEMLEKNNHMGKMMKSDVKINTVVQMNPFKKKK